MEDLQETVVKMWKNKKQVVLSSTDQDVKQYLAQVP